MQIQIQKYTAQVLRGDQIGRQINYPTINLNPLTLPPNLKRGVYASQVWVGGQAYQGALYFGPRVVKNEEFDVLEIYLLDFEGELYEQAVEFTLEKFIRGVMDFPTLEELRLQIKQDILAVKEALS
ncbi:MAG TPA: riboflavin kinase [Patescibacteria group bacterium]|jgi:riboflavin kinase/FMN adenylyltransferase